MAKVKNFKKRIVKFITKEGMLIEDKEQISMEISKELSDRYIYNGIPINLDTSNWERITQEITNSENIALTRFG